MEYKITQFRLGFKEKSRSEIRRENLISKREKMTQFYKIKLINASLLKSNVIGWKIRKKTHNLTQNHAQNDPIY